MSRAMLRVMIQNIQMSTVQETSQVIYMQPAVQWQHHIGFTVG